MAHSPSAAPNTPAPRAELVVAVRVGIKPTRIPPEELTESLRHHAALGSAAQMPVSKRGRSETALFNKHGNVTSWKTISRQKGSPRPNGIDIVWGEKFADFAATLK